MQVGLVGIEICAVTMQCHDVYVVMEIICVGMVMMCVIMDMCVGMVMMCSYGYVCWYGDDV